MKRVLLLMLLAACGGGGGAAELRYPQAWHLDVDLEYPQRPAEMAAWTSTDFRAFEEDVAEAIRELFDPTHVHFETSFFGDRQLSPVQDPVLYAFAFVLNLSNAPTDEVACPADFCDPQDDPSMVSGAAPVFAYAQAAGLGYDDLVRAIALEFGRRIAMAYGIPAGDLPDPYLLGPGEFVGFSQAQVDAIDAAISYP
jgi:hypothetical protein